jgi:hypothetical protein
MARKRGKYKQKVGFSIDKINMEYLNNYCEENYINKSQLVNKLISNFLKKVKKEDVKADYMEL